MSDLGPLRPRADEVARLTRSVDAAALGSLRDGLRPTPTEVARLRARVRPARRRVAMPVLALAVAALLLAFFALDRSPSVEVGLTLSAEAAALGPSIRTWGDARVTTRTYATGALVILEPGTAWFEVDPNGDARALEVRAGEVTVTVTGTRFVVVYDEAVTVRVERGSVRLSHPDGVVAVGAGGSWTNAPDLSPKASPPEDALPPQGADPSPPAPASPADEAAQAPAASPAAAAASAPAGPRPEAASPTFLAPGAAASDFAALLDRADRDDPQLVPAIEAFLGAHPDGPLAAEAELLRLGALARTSPTQAERAAAAWLAANPGAARRGEVLWLHATVARDALQDCGLALPSYRELASAGPRIAEASAMRGLCASALGRQHEAQVALERALELGVGPPLAEPVAAALAKLPR